MYQCPSPSLREHLTRTSPKSKKPPERKQKRKGRRSRRQNGTNVMLAKKTSDDRSIEYNNVKFIFYFQQINLALSYKIG